ncbi:MAG: recombinase family protein [Bosea sp.]|uniref:recombinase family protein n=1 Tax=Bosea sp. (in: a-proteobacteria) TaxID=1871050 RepID=UPI0023945D6F|nr:recombinase family protein [Bosea sp. (in: a-proteobacteria)]MCP4733815.1 recombinase family protein [Bosea sp. (in: a-proteobacteria)]
MRDLAPRPQRCAIYTRKSTEHNLDLTFNSLDAQREAWEAYIKSQAHEGWRLVPQHYDDGGLSGASLERPALQQLLAAVGAGEIDIIVVYKVDRLTRSLADFAKLVELFDANAVSFVSVTQSFNTTSSMRRLTLNVLLSFAQFEREVIGERVRDKVAASRRKGLWMGGTVPLGYRNAHKKLAIDEQEAAQVRQIFALYLELGSIGALADALDRQGIRSRQGFRFSVGALRHLLRNSVYRGEVVWQGRSYRGEHDAIIAADLFARVQAHLAAATGQRRRNGSSEAAILAGLLHDDAGNRMSPSHTNKAGIRYRYYVSQALLQHHKAEAGRIARISAPEIEAAVLNALRADEIIGAVDLSTAAQLAERVSRITLHPDRLAIVLNSETKSAAATLVVPFAWQSAGRRQGIAHEPASRPRIDPVSAQTLMAGVARSRRWMVELLAGSVSIAGLAGQAGIDARHLRQLLPLACLSPRIVEAIANGTAPANLTLSALTSTLPHDWAEQEQRFLIG